MSQTAPIDTGISYRVISGRGTEHARYAYAEMAEAVADRCNRDPMLALYRPFQVEAVASGAGVAA